MANRSKSNNMVHIPGGTFMMGSSANEPGHKDNEGPQHKVTLSAFYMGKYEVTQAEYKAIMGTTVQQQRDKEDKSYSMCGEGDNYPMYYVNWYEVIEYCNKRSQKEGLTPAYTIIYQRDPNYTIFQFYKGPVLDCTVTWNRNANGYRLPTEAEWEYAAKGGNGSPGNYIYSGSNNINDVAWYEDNSGGMTHEVGKKAPNSLGLYDMSGNVREWCWDWYLDWSLDKIGYLSSVQIDPMGPNSGSFRVMRGGGYGRNTDFARSSYRAGNDPNLRSGEYGFRVVRS